MFLMFLVALQLVIDFKPQATQTKKIKLKQLIPAGFSIGFISAMIAIGGGSLTVPYLNWHRINIRKAIATAASIGLPIAIGGSLVFATQNQSNDTLLNHTIGYIYWPATLFITLGSLITTTAGANLTHRLPAVLLKRVFALLIMVLAIKMFYSFH